MIIIFLNFYFFFKYFLKNYTRRLALKRERFACGFELLIVILVTNIKKRTMLFHIYENTRTKTSRKLSSKADIRSLPMKNPHV